MTSVHALPAVRAWNNSDAVLPRGTLIVIPGRGEHPGTYDRFGTRIAFDGYRVRAVADPNLDRAGVKAQIAELLTDETLPAPRVLVGSDSGALVAIALASELPVDGLILAGLPADGATAAPA